MNNSKIQAFLNITIKSFLKWSIFALGFIFTSIFIVYAITYPATPSSKTWGGEFMNFFNKMLVSTWTTSDGTVKKSEWVWQAWHVQEIYTSNTGSVWIGTSTPKEKLDIQWWNLNIWASWWTNEICLNGNCMNNIPDKQKWDILFFQDKTIPASAISSAYGTTQNEKVNNLFLWAWYKWVDRVWAQLWWSTSQIISTKSYYSNINDMRASIATSGDEWGRGLISRYLVPWLKDLGYGQYTIGLENCVWAPMIFRCTEWFACAYETYHPWVDAFWKISCIWK